MVFLPVAALAVLVTVYLGGPDHALDLLERSRIRLGPPSCCSGAEPPASTAARNTRYSYGRAQARRLQSHLPARRISTASWRSRGVFKDTGKRMRDIPMLIDLDERFRVMDRFEDYHQILSIATPPIEVQRLGDRATTTSHADV